MPGKFNYEIRHKYPHLLGEDKEVWDRFIKNNPGRFETVDYDFKVGEGVKVFTTTDDKAKQYWETLTKKRIDVIGYKRDFATIIEVKKRVGLYTLGQVLGYRFLFHREHPDIKLLPVLVVCERIGKDDIDVLNHYGIKFEVI